MKRSRSPGKRKAVAIGGVDRGLPAVKLIKHRSPMGVLRAFFSPHATPEEVAETPGMLKAIREMGVWAFCETRAKPAPIIHYWHSARANPLHVAYVLGHEVGHISGRPLRADEYGAAAFLAAQVALASRRW